MSEPTNCYVLLAFVHSEEVPHNEREITAARSRGSNLGLSSIRARQPESGALDFQSSRGAAEGDLEAGAGSVKGSAEPERQVGDRFGLRETGFKQALW
jgi:hypothetical protein